MKAFSSTVLALVLSSANATGSLDSKMNAKPATGDFEVSLGTRTRDLSSKAAIYFGTCSSESPFEFTIGGKAGKGAVGFDDTARVVSVMPTDQEEAGTVELVDKPSNFFGWSGDDIQGYPITYSDFSKQEGSTLKVLCDNDEEGTIIVMVSDEGGKSVDGIVKNFKLGQEFVITEDGVIDKVDTFEKTRSTNNFNLQELRAPIVGDKKAIRMRRDPTGDKGVDTFSVIHMTVEDSEGYVIPKSVVIKNNTPAPTSIDMGIEVGEIKPNKDGDAELDIIDMCKNTEDCPARVKMDLRLGVNCNGIDIPIVDMSAIIPTDDPKMIVNGGWIRSALHKNEVCDTDDWSVVVMDAIASDPMDGYVKVGKLIVDEPGVGRKLRVSDPRFRNLLQVKPTEEELSITEEMTVGRKPEHMQIRRGLRTEVHKKILSHGYCADETPFPLEDFDDNAIAFADPLGYTDDNNWRHDEFALKIKTFSEEQGIDGCGLIGHSQGGCASLHLKHYYWSCLDNASVGGGDRLIQTVGTPYKGSPAAGWIADVGSFIGVGCGYNEDLDTSGANTWLDTIPESSRGNNYYYTTSYEDRWFLPDWCSFTMDLILSGFDDGAVEKFRGQLEGGNNMGHTQGQCHVDDMSWPNQTKDEDRNQVLNYRSFF